MPYDEGLRIIEGKEYFYTTKIHLGILNYYMQDAPNIQKQIGEMKRPEHKNLIKLAEDYHNIVCTDGSPCIIFEKKLPPIKVAVDVIGGMAYYRSDVSLATGGVLLNIWMPRANEKMYFRTGLLYSKYEYINEYNRNTEHFNLYKIPIMAEYIYPKSIIRPKFAYGLNYYIIKDGGYSGFGQMVACMGGLNIWLHKSMSISLEYNIDFDPGFLFFPKQLISHSFLGGLHFRF
jgi:hypothetical protein